MCVSTRQTLASLLIVLCPWLIASASGEGLHLPEALERSDENSIDMVIDGVLDEPIWETIQGFSGFKVISPDTLDKPSEKTLIKLFYTDQGLYFAAIMDQAPDTLVERLSGRDQFIERDRISLSVDASGEGLYAYWFAVNLGGSLMDGTILPERDYSSNWDGPWRGASQKTSTGWNVEMMLPWSMMALPASENGIRQLGLYVQRAVAHKNEDWAYPALPRTQNQFLSRFPKTRIIDIRPKQQFTFYPYASASYDAVEQVQDYKTGFDVFWRPTTAFQLSGSFRPDFGNVESDNVVVNLTSYETFFPEKRPFFLEGQEIFTTSPRANPGWGGGTPTTLINTRRIGAPPEALSESQLELAPTEANRPSELIAAAKATGQTGRFRYGLLVASEDDTRLTGLRDGQIASATQTGRDFSVVRLLYENAQGTGRNAAGFMLTQVNHASMNANSFGVDLHRLSKDGKIIFDFQSLHSDTGDQVGHGAFADLLYRPAQGRQHSIKVDLFDRDLDINDFGYIQRNDLKGYRYRYERIQSDLTTLQSKESSLSVTQRWNFAGEQVRVALSGSQSFNFNNFTRLKLSGSFYPSRWEDRDSQGNGSFRLRDRFQTSINYESDSAQPFAYEFRSTIREESIGGMTKTYAIELKYQPSDRLSAELNVSHEQRTGWLLHQDNGSFSRFNSEHWKPRAELSSFFSAVQQMRISMQWIGIKAFERDRWRLPDGSKRLITASLPANDRRDFSISRLSFQARYRWELAPLSDFFIVYTRGSDIPSNLERDFSEQFSEAWEQALVDSLVLKLRYRFGS